MTASDAALSPLEIEPWPTERLLLALSVLVSLAIWVLAALSIVGLVYAGMLGIFFFLTHVLFVAHVRGSGVRLGPDQFPELHARIESLAHRLGLNEVPEAYLLQAGGTLNAFATRFLRSHMVVLFSDLLDACGDNQAARDMIIAHELGHIHAGHLRWRWLTAPAFIVPFLGTALSRAREYTCDRYGFAEAGDKAGALRGLAILAAGATHGPRVNLQGLVRQRAAFNSGWMTLGEWLGTHPPLAKRVAALDPALGVPGDATSQGPVRALGIVAAVFVPLAFLVSLGMSKLPRLAQEVNRQQAMRPALAPDRQLAIGTVQHDFDMLVEFLASERAVGRGLPADASALYARWKVVHPSEAEPVDPFAGERYGYTRRGGDFVIWSIGPDREWNTADDVIYDSRAGKASFRGARGQRP